MQEFDVIIIGAGPGGYTLAAGEAAAGKRTLLIERAHPGGTCLNHGCIPTKALRKSALVYDECRRSGEFGVECGTVTFDYAAIHDRVESVVAELRSGIDTLLSGVTRVTGTARFKDSATVEVEGELFTAPLIVVSTGSKPALLPIPGADLCITSDDLLSADTLPGSMVIVGGGVIGMEFACILNSFGVKATVVEYCKEILPAFDGEVAKRLRMTLKRRGINVFTAAAVKSVEQTGDNFRVSYEAKGKIATVDAAKVLMSVGRRPVLPEGLVEAGVELTPRGFIKVDDCFNTNVNGIKAIGDVNGLCLLAHAAESQAHALHDGHSWSGDCVPGVAFTDPECSMVGLTEEAAHEANIGVKVGKAMFRSNGYAMAIGETDGLVKVIASSEEGRLLGTHIVGPGASELIAEAALAIRNNLTVADIVATVHAHPTLSEVFAAACRAAL